MSLINYGDAEPIGVRDVIDAQGDVWCRRPDGLWETHETALVAWKNMRRTWFPMKECNR